MEQITSMKITGIKFTDFRNHKAPESYSFGDISYITGHNGAGKTTMAHGICYALYGVSYYGEQKIERMMNETAAGTQVQLDFIDQNSKEHTLIRNRNGDKTTVLLDGYSIRQTDIDRMFCDKETFLSMFNPTFLTERLGEKGRSLILKYLKPVSSDAVMDEISKSYREFLDNVDLCTVSPENQIKNYREAIRQADTQSVYLQGNIETIEKAQKTAEQKLIELCRDRDNIIAKQKALSDKQFDGIETDDLSIQRDMILAKLSEKPKADNPEVALLRNKITEIRQKTYISQYLKAQAENAATVKSLAEEYKTLAERIKRLKPGAQCPTCKMRVTEQNLSNVRSSMMMELKALGERGNKLLEERRELTELDSKAKMVFEQFKADDLQKLLTELERLEGAKKNDIDTKELRDALEHIDELQKYGNLSLEEFAELNSLSAELTGVEAQIKTIMELTDTKKLDNAYAEQKDYEEKIVKYKNILSALNEFVCKRTEMTVAHLQMPNVKIKLFDIVRTTGEVVNVFKFTYKGHDYNTLSLSEKTLAGIEITAMLRKITDIDCPVCVDNTESIAAFNQVSMPSQTLLLRFVKGQPLKVQSRNNNVMLLRTEKQELKKAS